VERTSEHRLATAVVLVALAAAATSLLSAAVLSFSYQPAAAQAWDDPTLDGPGRGWVLAHAGVTWAWLLACVAAGVALAVLAARRGTARRAAGLAMVGVVVSGMGATVVLATRGMVQWDNIALRAVTVGGGMDGYWNAALDDGVAFVLVEGTEVARGDYAVSLAVHVLGHVIGVAAVGVALVLARRPWTSGGSAAPG
jgi:hypothetical protein